MTPRIPRCRRIPIPLHRWAAVPVVCLVAACSDVRVVAVDIAVIELEPPNASVMVGETVQLAARVLDGSGNLLSGRDIDWSSSDSAAVTVDGTGLVHGIAAGYATVTAASAGSRATAEIIVNRPAPGLTSVQPSSAQRLQSVELVLTGSNFQEDATVVDLGAGITVDAITVTSPGSITATVTISAGAQLGARDIIVTNPAPGGGTATLPGGFTVLAQHPFPAVTAVSPSAGQREATLDVTLSGSGFIQGVTTVSFGTGITVDAVHVASAVSLRASIRIGAGAALGPRAVSVSNPAPGGGSASLPAAFTVMAANPRPALTGASPSVGQRQTTLDVTLTGSGFLDGRTTVAFGPGISVTSVVVGSPTTLVASISIAADATLGPRDVVVTNPPPGGGSATLSGGFTILPQNPSPDVTGASPASGQRRDRLDVTLTGSGFIPDLTTVTFGPDITVDAVQVNGPTSLIATIRIGAGATLGARSVAVTNPAPGGGTGTLPDGFTVLEENPAPTLNMALPGVGIRGTTMNVTLLGSGFVQGLTSVSFGEGIVVNSVNVVFWTSLTANITIAAEAATGPRNVSVTNAPPGGGTFIMHDGFSIL